MLFMVYGTLKAGHYNNYILADAGATLVGPATVEGFTLWEIPQCYPMATPAPDGRITGEVWDVPTDGPAIARLDRLEGVPRMYTRETVTTTDGREVQLYVYASDPVAQRLVHVGEVWPKEVEGDDPGAWKDEDWDAWAQANRAAYDALPDDEDGED